MIRERHIYLWKFIKCYCSKVSTNKIHVIYALVLQYNRGQLLVRELLQKLIWMITKKTILKVYYIHHFVCVVACEWEGELQRIIAQCPMSKELSTYLKWEEVKGKLQKVRLCIIVNYVIKGFFNIQCQSKKMKNFL